ncbi:MAG: helix-turn-helix domain-containing protein [Lachnospiraceae bacterium]|nr:helix-turn-helix domain-containing protein [Lachnospiraceae bacterium]
MRSRSYIATPPGATIKEHLTDRGMSQKEFAARMDLSEKHISKLINGDVQLTPDVAVRLEIVLGAPAGFWNRLEAIYREKLIKVEAENSMDTDELLVKQLPYSEMAKLGWVPETKNSKERVTYLRRYFEVVKLSLLEKSQITKIACRRLEVTEKGDLTLLAWTQEAKLKAREISTAPLNISRLIEILPSIKDMSSSEPNVFCETLKTSLANCGIALVFLPHLKGSFLQGASFMEGNKIVLGLTARGKDADIFWFSLFHELGHIVLGHIGLINGTTNTDELEADRWAREALIPSDSFQIFIEEGNYSSASVLAYAAALGIAPGIVVGRMQHEGCIDHSALNNLKAHYEIAV